MRKLLISNNQTIITHMSNTLFTIFLAEPKKQIGIGYNLEVTAFADNGFFLVLFSRKIMFLLKKETSLQEMLL